MKIDHTKEIEKMMETIAINLLDGCSFYTPKEGSLLSVYLCAYCHFSVFDNNNKNGFCKFRLVEEKEKNHES